MNAASFKSNIEQVLVSAGFERHEKSLRRYESCVWTLVGIEKGFGPQWHINVGFWLEALDGKCTARVEQSHLYFRLERVFPEHRETITLAGALGDSNQPEAYAALLALLQGDIDRQLRALGTEAGLRAALTAGRLIQGLITKGAREHLRGK
jgi:hypothetical protein